MCDMYLKDSRFIEDMEKTVVPKLSKMKESGYYGTKDGKRLYYEKFILNCFVYLGDFFKNI